MMLFQLRRAVMFSGVIVMALLVAIASVVFSGHQMDRLVAQVFPSTAPVAIRQLWQAPQPTSTVSLNQISGSLSSTWRGTNHLDGLSPCHCPVCQGITV
jgi:hypothetical protein